MRAGCAAAKAISAGLRAISMGVRIGASRNEGAALSEGGFAFGWEAWLRAQSLLVFGIFAGCVEDKSFLGGEIEKKKTLLSVCSICCDLLLLQR